MEKRTSGNGLLKALGLAAAGAVGLYALAQKPSFSESPSLESNGERTKKEYRMPQEGIDLIKRFEGYSEKVYPDAVGKPTIGYGHLVRQGENYSTINKMEAELLLRKDLRTAEKAVDELVKVELTDNQYAALVSFAYNLGGGNLLKSTLLRKVNAGDFDGAADEFLRWNKAGGKVLKGLTKRRTEERDLFLKR